MMGRKNLGIYVHVPFCRQKCVYCDFYSLPRREDQMDAYVSALEGQLDRFSPEAEDYDAASVYFGGGTPSYLGPDRLCRLLQRVRTSFHTAWGAEITLEANPDSASELQNLPSFAGRASTVFPWGCSPPVTKS